MNYACLLPNISYPIGKSIYDGFCSAASDSGDTVTALLVNSIDNKNSSYVSQLLSLLEKFDGIVAYGGGLGQFTGEERTTDFLGQLSLIKPLVNIGYRINGFNNINIDNYNGMKQLILHLVEVHGYHKIAFVKGPDGHPEAEERLSAYRDVLIEQGIEVDNNLILPGDFSGASGREAAEILVGLQRSGRISAAAFGCDSMAAAGISVFERQGIYIPNDLAVTGFDHSSDSMSRFPGISTVDQNPERLGVEACKMIRKLINGNSGELYDLRIPVQTVIYGSCGCLPELNGRSGLPERTHDYHLIPLPDEIIRHCTEGQLDSLMSALLLDIKEDGDDSLYIKMLLSFGITEYLERYLSELTYRDVEAFISDHRKRHMSLLSESEIRRFETVWHQMRIYIHSYFASRDMSEQVYSDTLMLSLNILSNKLITLESFTQIRPLVDEVLDNSKIEMCGIFVQKGMEYSLEYLYHRDREFSLPVKLPKQYESFPFLEDIPEEDLVILRTMDSGEVGRGIILFTYREKLSLHDGVFIDSLSSQIASSLKQIHLISERNRAQESLKEAFLKLKKTNRTLENLSYKDELTGLYNRRGFMELAKDAIDRCIREGKDFLILFGDLDGLKLINDSYGHKEGDFAIKSVGTIIHRVCRDTDIMARLGGDEFIALLPHIPDDYKAKLKERLLHSEREENRICQKPYRISCSFGMVRGSDFPGEDLQMLMSHADRELYLEKSRRYCEGSRAASHRDSFPS